MSKREAASTAARKMMDQEMALAEARGRAQLAAEVRAMLEERRRVVRLGDHQIEVVEVSAVEGVLDPHR